MFEILSIFLKLLPILLLSCTVSLASVLEPVGDLKSIVGEFCLIFSSCDECKQKMYHKPELQSNQSLPLIRASPGARGKDYACTNREVLRGTFL